MGLALSRNWPAIKALYLQGVSVSKIAKEHNVKAPTITARARRGNWKAEQQEVSRVVASDVASRAQQWRMWAIDAADRFLQALRALPKSRVDKLTRQDVQSLRDVIEAGLRAYGLDKQGQDPVRIGVYVGSSGTSVVLKSGSEPTQVIGNQAPIIDCGSANQADSEQKPAD